MRRFLLRWWPGIYLLIPLLTSGCQHSQPCCSTCVCMGAPVAVPSCPAPAVEPPAQPSKPAQTPIKMLPSVIPASTAPALTPATDAMLSLAPPPHPTAAAQPDRRPALPAPVQDVQEEDRPRFAHDPKYHWLVGTLDYSRIQQAWILRYVSFEEEDRYGGCVTLVAPSRTMTFKPGQIVRVEGALIDPDSQQLRPAFQVQKIRVE
jgi:hypothetical protein